MAVKLSGIFACDKENASQSCYMPRDKVTTSSDMVSFVTMATSTLVSQALPSSVILRAGLSGATKYVDGGGGT